MKRRRKVTKVSPQPAVVQNTAAKAEAKGSLTFRIDDDLETRMLAVCDIVGIDKSALGRMCLEAVVKMIERDRRISLPLELAPVERTTTVAEV